jgi:phosphoribosylformylglycinamidine cyclo-ligase
MGHRMEIYVSPEDAEKVIAISESFGIEAKIIGRVEDAPANKLTIISENGTYEY